MIIYYGWRWYGRAFGRGNERAMTRCFHLFLVPLIPLSQMWVTAQTGKQLRGLPIQADAWAGLRVLAWSWGAIAAAIAAASSPIAGAVVAAAAIAVGVVAIRKTTLRGRDLVRVELAREVLGTSCPPELLTRPTAQSARAELERAWAVRCPDRPPEDVATLGPRDRGEAALAYCLLAVSAQTIGGRRRRELLDRAGRVLDALDRAPSLPQGAPYRAEVQVERDAPAA